MTATSVKIGFQYVDVGSGTGGVLGKNVSIGDPPAQARAIRDWVNGHGGLGGRKMEIDAYGVPYGDYISNPQQAYNTVCTHYTQDVKVLAVAVYVPDRTLVDCLAKRDVISVADGYSLGRHEFDEYSRYYWSPGSMSQDRGAEVGVAGLVDAKFLGPNAKIGLVRYDTETYARAEVSLSRALVSRGLKIDQTRTISDSNISQAESDAAAAVLDFSTRGITHVMFLDNSGGIAFAFMQAADSQKYTPFYALTTNNNPASLRQLAPAQQLEKAQAISWWSGDIGPDNLRNATPPALPTSRALCLQIYAKAGVQTSGTSGATALITCDQLLFLKAVLDHTRAPNSAAMADALDGLGSAYSSPMSYATKFERGRHDAAYITRRIRYDKDSKLWVYAGPGPTA